MKDKISEKRAWLLSLGLRVIFGLVWLIDGALKFQPGIPSVFPSLIQNVSIGQPAWLMPWFNYWHGVVGANPVFWVYLIGTGEILLALGLIFGFMKKITYSAGIMLSLLIWAVPEGFGGPYGPSSTDIGTGIIYALLFVALIVINKVEHPNRYSFDYFIGKKIRWWHRIAEF